MKLLTALCSLFLLSDLAAAQGFQQWNEIDLAAKVGKVDLLFPLLARTDSYLPNPQLAATGIIANYPFRRHLILTAAYLYADLPQLSDHVHLPVVALMPVFHEYRFAFADMNRFERLIGYPGSPYRYRNKLIVDRPLGADRNWHLFASNEAFFNLSAGNWNQNRFQAGVGRRLNHHVSVDLYYLERVANGAAQSANILGTTLTMRLTPVKGEKDP